MTKDIEMRPSCRPNLHFSNQFMDAGSYARKTSLLKEM